MTAPVDRAQALRGLIERVEAGEGESLRPIGFPFDVMDAEWVYRAVACGSLDAVARLEAGLRERGWVGPKVDPVNLSKRPDGSWWAGWSPWDYTRQAQGPWANAPTEPRARLLAVLRAMLFEAEQSPLPTDGAPNG